MKLLEKLERIDPKNWNEVLKMLSEIEDEVEELMFLNRLKRKIDALPKEDTDQVKADFREIGKQILRDTQKLLAEVRSEV